jgi:hypothetical protein
MLMTQLPIAAALSGQADLKDWLGPTNSQLGWTSQV